MQVRRVEVSRKLAGLKKGKPTNHADNMFELICTDVYLSEVESAYDDEGRQLPYKYELVIRYLPDPRIEGTFLFDDKFVRRLQSRRCLDVLIGRIKQKRRIRAGKKRFKMTNQGNRSVPGLQTSPVKSEYEVFLQQIGMKAL